MWSGTDLAVPVVVLKKPVKKPDTTLPDEYHSTSCPVDDSEPVARVGLPLSRAS